MSCSAKYCTDSINVIILIFRLRNLFHCFVHTHLIVELFFISIFLNWIIIVLRFVVEWPWQAVLHAERWNRAWADKQCNNTHILVFTFLCWLCLSMDKIIRETVEFWTFLPGIDASQIYRNQWWNLLFNHCIQPLWKTCDLTLHKFFSNEKIFGFLFRHFVVTA